MLCRDKYSKFLALTLASLSQTAFADLSSYSSLSSFSFSEPVPVYEAVNDWQGKFEGGDLAFTYNRFELGVAWNNLRFGYVARYDYRLEFNQDTARFYYEQENDIAPTLGKTYTMDIDALHQRSQGVAVHYDWQVREDLKLTPSLTLLYANAVIDGRLAGNISHPEDDTYIGSLAIDYYYLEDFLFERDVKKSDYRGLGYTLDLQLDWNPTDVWQLQLKTHDLFGIIHWDDLPRTVAVANTEPVQTDDPFERYKTSALQGRESNRSFRQHLPTRIELNTRYRLNDFSLVANLYQEPDRTFFFPSVAYGIDNFEVALVAEPFVKALGVRVSHPWASFSLISDSLDHRKAHFLTLGLSVHIPFF